MHRLPVAHGWANLHTSQAPAPTPANKRPAAASASVSVHDQTLTDDGNALIAIGPAAGGAVVGLLSPTGKKPDSQG